MQLSNAFTPIIKSLLDADVYKMYIIQQYFVFYGMHTGEYAFKLRTPGIKQADIISMKDLREQFDYCRELTLNSEDREYLESRQGPKGHQLFRKDFIKFLKDYHLSSYTIKEVDGNYDIRSNGILMNASYWETLMLAINSQLYYDGLPGLDWKNLFEEGRRRLREKIYNWRGEKEMHIAEFGTRRRRSAEWQEEVVCILAEELKEQFLGTSNMYLAKKYNLNLIGSMAHEQFMIGAGVDAASDEGIKNASWKVLRQYHELYPDLSIALPDTFGSEYFFNEIPQDLAETFDDYRHDSNDPIRYTKKVAAFVEKRKLDATKKGVVFSDGLTGASSIEVYRQARNIIAKSKYAIGTDLSCDFGIPNISIVMKPVYVNDAEGIRRPLVKLSDNPAKVNCEDTTELERYQKIFKYNPRDYEYVACHS